MQSATARHGALPWRSDAAAPAPAALALPRPGDAPWRATKMPMLRAGRPLKRWRYVGLYAPELMLCIGDVHIGPARQTFWGIWDRQHERLYERTKLLSHRGVVLEPGRARVRDSARGIEIDVTLEEEEGVTSVCPHGRSGYVWTRKQAGIAAHARVTTPGSAPRTIDAFAVVDDTAGYHARTTAWIWSAGVGVTASGSRVAWNLVTGVNDPASGSERTVWVDGVAHEVGPVRFADDLGEVEFADGNRLCFVREATRARRDKLLLISGDYEQPFGTFAGALADGVELQEGFGVMERHSARW